MAAISCVVWTWRMHVHFHGRSCASREHVVLAQSCRLSNGLLLTNLQLLASRICWSYAAPTTAYWWIFVPMWNAYVCVHLVLASAIHSRVHVLAVMQQVTRWSWQSCQEWGPMVLVAVMLLMVVATFSQLSHMIGWRRLPFTDCRMRWFAIGQRPYAAVASWWAAGRGINDIMISYHKVGSGLGFQTH